MTSPIVTIPISNDGEPGVSNTIIPLTLSSPGGSSFGTATTASLVIHDDDPFLARDRNQAPGNHRG